MLTAGVGALVTGAASGLGLATARALARAGAQVAMLDVDGPALQREAGDLGGLAVVCDLRDVAATEDAVRTTLASVGTIRIVATCAGVGRVEPLVGPQAAPFAQLIETIQLNLIGTLNVVRLVAADLITRDTLEEGERGSFILVASGAAFDGPTASAAYAASKGGIVSLTLALAREFGDAGIRVNAISPGVFATPMMSHVPPDFQRETPAMTPFPKRMGHADEFAALALHACTNRFLNGAVLRLDGARRTPYYSRQ